MHHQELSEEYFPTDEKFMPCQESEPVAHFLRLKEHHGEVSHVSERVSVHVPFPINNCLHIVLEKVRQHTTLQQFKDCM